jgi:hypothetical protein
MNTLTIPRNLIVFAVILPLAALLGYMLAKPEELNTFLVVGLLVGALSFPVLLRWHHPLLIFTWNASLNVFLLPGQPAVWMVLAVGSLFFLVLNRAMGKQTQTGEYLNVPAITWPLVLFTALVLITAKITGGIGLHSFGGGTYGGKGYFHILFAIAGYFALSSQRIPPRRRVLYITLFFLSGLTAALSNLAYAAGPAFYWLFLLFPMETITFQVAADYSVTQNSIERFTGVTAACIAGFTFMMARYGIRGILDVSKPWRLGFFLLILAASLFGGFRSVIVIFGLTFAIQFYFEGLFRTRLFLLLLVGGITAAIVILPFANKLPRSVQRTFSFLPLDLDPATKADSQASLEWRLEMWHVLLPDVGKYLFKGKGYSINPTDIYLADESIRRGLSKNYEASIIAGDYHNGPLSVLIPFGIYGMILFVWFLIAALWALRRNYLYGELALKRINTFLLAYAIMRMVFFFVFFGGLTLEFFYLCGLLGLSVSLNGGVRSKADRQDVVAPAKPATA